MSPLPHLHVSSDHADAGFDSLFEVEPLLLHSIDDSGTLLNVSTAWARLLGYSRDELIGRRTVDVMAPASRAYALTTGLPLLYARGHVTNIPYEFLRADGRPIPVLLSSGAITDENGRFLRSLTVITDDRRARYAERELNARDRREAGGADALRGLLERLGHETRTPLGAILGFATLMEQGELPDEQRARLAQVMSAAEGLRSALDAALTDAEASLAPRRASSAPSVPMGRPGTRGTQRRHLPLAPMRVLLALGEANRQDSLRELLRAGGHKVVTVGNGYEAIEALFSGPVDLAIMGLDMPGLSGPATVAQIRNSGRSFRNIPVIACGSAAAPALSELRAMGMNGCLPPDCTQSTLEAEMRRALETRAS
ncbi:ATP-binding response regulator [Vannielia litorea]|uniref:ATP-binding response regulator n=1 Tax=Vannielia litorea TaxID=1217970 RepID=UPI001BCF2784|nr:PAS domain S-box protein [Vannielia litorea]MBS8229145.1 PAS domain S-box protein [Vannielia litorea]